MKTTKYKNRFIISSQREPMTISEKLKALKEVKNAELVTTMVDSNSSFVEKTEISDNE